MEVFMKETSFHGVMLDQLFTAPPELKKKLHDLLNEGIAAGAVRPLPRTVFPTTEVEQAFRYSYHDGDKLMKEIRTNMLSLS
jgi:fatty acid synthase